MSVTNLHSMTLAEAEAVLAGIGYCETWTAERLRAAVPADMIQRVVLALRVSAAAARAEANGLEPDHGE